MEKGFAYKEFLITISKFSVIFEFVRETFIAVFIFTPFLSETTYLAFFNNIILLIFFIPSCFFGIIAYVILEEQPIEKSLVWRYFLIKRFVTILWVFEALSVSAIGFINKVPSSTIITISSTSLGGIMLDCFFLHFIWKCHSYLEKEEPCGNVVTLSDSSLTNNPTASTIVIGVEIKETQGDIEDIKGNHIKPCQPVIHDFTVTDCSIHIDDSSCENKV